MITLDEDAPESTDQLNEESLAVVEEAKALTIETDEDAEKAGEFLRLRVKAIIKKANESFDPLIASSRAHTKKLRDEKERIVGPLRLAESAAKRLIAAYYQAQERKRQEEIRQAEKAARKKAEQEALERALALEKEGHDEAAEAEIVAPQPVQVVKPVREKPKVTGVSVRKTWDWRFTDEGQTNRDFLAPDKAKIGKTVRALGPDAAALVGGIQVFQKTSVASRSQ